MKKRLVAFLLVLIMVLGMLPVSAFAADASASWRVSVQINEGHYYKFDGTENGTNQHRSTLSVDGSRGHTFGCTFIWNRRAGGEIYAGGWQLCLTVDGTIAMQTDAYVYSRDMTGAEVNIPGEVTVEDLRRGGESGIMLNMGNYPEKDYRRAQTYTLNYYKNTTDTVTNMPEPNPQTETSSTGTVTFNIPATKPTREGYNFLGWAGNPDATEPTVKPGNTVTTTATVTKLYAVWESKTPPTDKPSKPALNEGSPVLVQCVQAGAHTDSGKDSAKKYFALGGYAYRYEEVKKEGSNVWKDEADGKWTYQLKLKRDEFVKAYNNLSLVTTHTDTNPGEETYVTWKHDGTSWKLVPAAGQTGTRIGAVIKVKCTPVPTSDEPTLANTDLNLIVKCVTNNAAHSERSMPLKAGTFKMIGTVQDRGPLKFCTIEVETAQYVAAFDTGHPGTHTAAKTIRVELYLKKNDSTAKWTNNKSATDNVIEVTCEPKAPTADELKKLQMAVLVKCAVDASQQHTAAYGLLGECDVDYFVFEPRQEGDDWLCDISYYPERYVAEFNTTFQNLKHVQNDEKIVPVTLIWAGGSWQTKTQGRVYVTEVYTVTYTDGVDGEEVFADQVYSDLRKDSTTPAFNGTPTRTGYTFAGWEPEVAATVTQTVTYVAKWEAKKANVHLMIFKSGDLSKPIVDVPYAADKLAGDTIDLTKIDPSSYLDFDFEIDGGWYDDGMFSSYKRYLDGLQDKPAGLEKLLITGNWQNLKLIVTELVPVVYFDSLESLTAYQNDHSKTEGILHTTKARLGSALPTADAPTATRDGYTFTFWSREGQTVDVTDQTVNGWTNLYANWEKKTYKVVAKLYVNGKPAYYQNTDFYTYEVSGSYGEDIDFDTIKAKAVEQAKQIKKASASYTAVILEDHEPNPVCTTYGEHQPGQATHYVKVNVKTEENVVIFQSFEGKTDLTKLHTTTAPYGTNVVEFLNDLGLDLEVAGYTLDTDEDGNTNWYKKDSPKWTFGANDTINGWTNVLLKYTVTPHNIYAYARLNSYVAPLTTSEFDTPVTLNEATLSRLGLGSYNSLGYISIGSFDFDAMPLTSDLYFDDDAELSAVAEKLATDIALETGVSKETAEKIAWTVLFKTENEEDMAPGYPAEDGYQLSGNLNLASVTFRAGAENVENMPAVNYTYDDGAIDFYDFYFAGDTITMPADPTRAKYTFMGWKAQVLPAEDDLDVYTDGAETDEGATLYKAGDTYTITDGGVIFTAQWELTATPIGDIYVRYDVLHIKQLPDGTYDLANAEVEHLNAKKDTTVTAVIKDYRATHHVNVNRTLSKLTDTAIRPYPGPDGKPVYTILTVYYDLDFHTLTFDTMGGSKIAPETVRHGLTVAKPKDPVNGGYIFDGWYTDKTFRHRYDFSTPLTEDITIYAKWFLIVLPGVTVKKNTPKLNTADHFAYVQGYPDGTVKPAGNITRAETAAILFRLMDDASRKTYYSTKSGFRDVASGSWYNTYVATLNNAGVITDSSNGYFRPNEAITRAELAAMLANFTETTGAANYFNDVSAKYWAANAIAICAKLGWINGYPDGTFRPDKNVTRAELMAMINRATGRAPQSADAFLPGMKTWSDNTADKWYYLDVQEATNSHSYTVKDSEKWTALNADPNWSKYE